MSTLGLRRTLARTTLLVAAAKKKKKKKKKKGAFQEPRERTAHAAS